jgi:uncharacterized protein (DUF1330 family)
MTLFCSGTIPRHVSISGYSGRAGGCLRQSRYLTNAGNTIDHVEGDWTPQNIVVLQFPSMQRAREWYRSPEYGEALVIRRTALHRNLVFVAGSDEPPEE